MTGALGESDGFAVAPMAPARCRRAPKWTCCASSGRKSSTIRLLDGGELRDRLAALDARRRLGQRQAVPVRMSPISGGASPAQTPQSTSGSASWPARQVAKSRRSRLVMSPITVGPTKPASAPAIVSSATASTRVAPSRSVSVLTIVAPEPLPLVPATTSRET